MIVPVSKRKKNLENKCPITCTRRSLHPWGTQIHHHHHQRPKNPHLFQTLQTAAMAPSPTRRRLPSRDTSRRNTISHHELQPDRRIEQPATPRPVFARCIHRSFDGQGMESFSKEEGWRALHSRTAAWLCHDDALREGKAGMCAYKSPSRATSEGATSSPSTPTVAEWAGVPLQSARRAKSVWLACWRGDYSLRLSLGRFFGVSNRTLGIVHYSYWLDALMYGDLLILRYRNPYL